MQQVTQTPRDPAPSRTAYRLQRMWLTPAYRKLVRTGLPLAITALAVGWYFKNPERQVAIANAFIDARRAVEERPEFIVKMLAVDGASPALSEAVRANVPYDFPLSSFDMDLEAIRGQVEKLDAVAKASVIIGPGGVLQISVRERMPVAVWRFDDDLMLLDDTGHPVAPVASRSDRADLPLIVGIGADAHVDEAIALYNAAGRLRDRVRGLVMMGERRWDVVLDRDQRIMLPEEDAVLMLERVIALDRAQSMLDRDIQTVDVRNPRRPTIRLVANAVEELRKIKGIEGVVEAQ